MEQGHFPPAMILRYCSALWAAFARAASWLEAKPWHTVMGWVESSTRHWHRPLRLRSSKGEREREKKEVSNQVNGPVNIIIHYKSESKCLLPKLELI